MKYIISIFLIVFMPLVAAETTVLHWDTNETFEHYLIANHISTDILETVSKEDEIFLSEMRSRYDMYELKESNGTLLQALIPISKEMQIHLSQDRESGKYLLDIIPIEYETHEYFAKVIVENNPYSDTLNTIHNKKLAKRLSSALVGTIESKKLQKGDEIDFFYTQSTRMGKPYLMPNIQIIRVVMGKEEKYIYVDEDGDGFIQTNKSGTYRTKEDVTYKKGVSVNASSSRFGMPLRHMRITSSFSYRRWHPILHIYRPHHGIDCGAKMGTPLLAINAGKVSYSGHSRGYGNVVKIKYAGGYESLYAHQSKRAVKVGQIVQKGQIIGYVGSTGQSTGPHLHFGLMKNGRWVDPMKVLGKKSIKTSLQNTSKHYKEVSSTRYRKVKIKGVKKKKVALLNYIKNKTQSQIWEQNNEK